MDQPHCSNCKVTLKKPLYCPCKQAAYCSKKCQKAQWKQHKKEFHQKDKQNSSKTKTKRSKRQLSKGLSVDKDSSWSDWTAGWSKRTGIDVRFDHELHRRLEEQRGTRVPLHECLFVNGKPTSEESWKEMFSSKEKLIRMKNWIEKNMLNE